MSAETKFQWKTLDSKNGAILHASFGYCGSYVIANSKRGRFTLTYGTSTLCCELVGDYGSIENAKRAARRHFTK